MTLPKLIVVLGTTACGKSGLGVELARRFDGEIVSADSRQVYRGLDLGTGKITPEEMQGVPHHMLDVVEPNQPYSVADFQRGAYAAIDGILERGKLPLLVGGTGLYVRAVTQGFAFTHAAPDPALRARLEGMGAQELYALWLEKTGQPLNQSEQHNRQRLVRAVEKAWQGGWQPAPSAPRYRCLLLGMDYPRPQLYRRIERRLTDRIDQGMIEEVEGLRRQGATDAFLEGLGLEYRYVLWYLTGRSPTGLLWRTSWAGPSSALPSASSPGLPGTMGSSGWTPEGIPWPRPSGRRRHFWKNKNPGGTARPTRIFSFLIYACKSCSRRSFTDWRNTPVSTAVAGVSPSHSPARSLVIMPPSMVWMAARSSLRAKSTSSPLPSSSPRLARAPVQAKRVAMGLVEGFSPSR